MERLTSVAGSFAAHVLAARLYDEGIDAELRGAVDGPYGLTVGDMARVDVFVPEDQMDDAQLVMLATEVDTAVDADLRPPRRPTWALWAAAAVVFVAAVAPVARYLTNV
jgi:hypothetical protein